MGLLAVVCEIEVRAVVEHVRLKAQLQLGRPLGLQIRVAEQIGQQAWRVRAGNAARSRDGSDVRR